MEAREGTCTAKYLSVNCIRAVASANALGQTTQRAERERDYRR